MLRRPPVHNPDTSFQSRSNRQSSIFRAQQLANGQPRSQQESGGLLAGLRHQRLGTTQARRPVPAAGRDDQKTHDARTADALHQIARDCEHTAAVLEQIAGFPAALLVAS